MDNLIEAHKQARKGKGHYQAVKNTDAHLEERLQEIQTMLKDGTYVVGEYKTQTIVDKGKTRNLQKLPYYPDRIIQWAIMLQIEDIFDKNICYFSCASIKNRGLNRAYNLTKRYLHNDVTGTRYCLKIDIAKFYENIDRQILKQMLATKFKDRQLLKLLYQIIDSAPKDKGVPIGAYLSQYFANFYLSGLDHYIKETLGAKYCIRYMDDIVIFNDSKEQLHAWRQVIEEYLNIKLNLKLKKNWAIFPTDVRGVDFVGYRFYHHDIKLRKRTAKNIKAHIAKVWKNRMINEYEYCMLYSFYGLTRYKGNCFRFYAKYIYPLLQYAYLYHIKKRKR